MDLDDTASLIAELVAPVCPLVGVTVGRRGDPSTFRLDFAPEATDEQKQAALDLLADMDWRQWQLQRYKDERLAAIDAHTETLIARGFAYTGPDGVARRFSLIREAQMNWTNLYQSRNIFAQPQPGRPNGLYPLGVSTLDDNEYQLADPNEVMTFYVTGLAVIKGVLDSGRALKLLVKNAADEAAVDAVWDPRG